jgi:hypothetical protein
MMENINKADTYLLPDAEVVQDTSDEIMALAKKQQERDKRVELQRLELVYRMQLRAAGASGSGRLSAHYFKRDFSTQTPSISASHVSTATDTPVFAPLAYSPISSSTCEETSSSSGGTDINFHHTPLSSATVSLHTALRVTETSYKAVTSPCDVKSVSNLSTSASVQQAQQGIVTVVVRPQKDSDNREGSLTTCNKVAPNCDSCNENSSLHVNDNFSPIINAQPTKPATTTKKQSSAKDFFSMYSTHHR